MTKNVNTSDIFHNSLSDYTLDPNDTISINTVSALGATGAVYTTGTGYTIGANGTSSVDWSNISVSSGWTTTSPTTISQHGVLDLRGKNADLKINGRSLMDAIDALEQRLNILVPNPELETEWDELRELGERYRELEKKCKEKGEMWKKLKQMPPPEIK
jgi:hypothetical protein